MANGKWLKEAEKKGYIAAMQNAERKYGIPQGYLVGLAEQESAFDPAVINGSRKSKVGAVGLMQFMPATSKELGINPLDPFEAIDGSAKYLAQLYKSTRSWKGALTSYNWGIGNYNKFLKGTRKDIPDEAANYAKGVINKASKFGGGDEALPVASSDPMLSMQTPQSMPFQQGGNGEPIAYQEPVGGADPQSLPSLGQPSNLDSVVVQTPDGEMEVLPESDEERSLVQDLSGSGDMLLQQVPELLKARDSLKQKPLLAGSSDSLDKLLGEIVDLS